MQILVSAAPFFLRMFWSSTMVLPLSTMSSDVAGGLRAVVGGKLDADKLAVEIQPLHQLRREHQGSVENTKQDRNVSAPVKVPVDLRGPLVNRGLDPLVRKERLE